MDSGVRSTFKAQPCPAVPNPSSASAGRWPPRSQPQTAHLCNEQTPTPPSKVCEDWIKEHRLSLYHRGRQTAHRKKASRQPATPCPPNPAKLTNGRGVIGGSEDQLRGPVVARADVGDVGLPPHQLLCTVEREGQE